jgi:polyhydroxyalkanoate synthase subunit PhaC
VTANAATPGGGSAAGASASPGAVPPGSAPLERQLLAQLAGVTGGLAPDDYLNAWWEWYLTLATHPDRQAALARSAVDKLTDSWRFALQAASGAPLAPEAKEHGFGDAAWNVWPFNVMARNYANWANWWQEALQPPAGAPNPTLARANFAGRLLLESASPANFLQTNPELLNKTVAESGQNLVRGLAHWLEDVQRAVGGGARRTGADEFHVGRNIAITPGRVVFRNRLIELIQYSPQTPSVYAEPVLITPAWIMKYYILDLSPQNSLVRYLVGQGHTVFMTSWKNPTAADGELGMDDYLRLGLLDAIEAVRRIVPERKLHAVGYCIGGTLLAIGAAALAAAGASPLASVSLLAAQTDFSEPGELSVFISPSQLAVLEALMHQSGVLDSERMAGAFTLLRSRDLLWTPAAQTYVRGERPKLTDLMAWNADGTRMPWRMHSEYLERLYLRNELAGGEFNALGRKIDLTAIRVPMFVVGTETDHVAPWRSVYKARALTRSPDYTFLLTSGGHNAGIVSGPVHPRRRYRVRTWLNDRDSLAADDWLRDTAVEPGSWWPRWQQWLAEHSKAKQVPARAVPEAQDGAALDPAPGRYVQE